MTAAALPGFPRPILRRRELGLLLAAAAALVLGNLSLGLTRTGILTLADPAGLLIYLAALVSVHFALVTAGRRVDEVLLPTVGLLGGIGLLLAERLPQDLVVQQVGPAVLGLASLQLVWLVLALMLPNKPLRSDEVVDIDAHDDTGLAATALEGHGGF